MAGRIVVWLVVQVYNDAERIKRLASARYKIGRCYEAHNRRGNTVCGTVQKL